MPENLPDITIGQIAMALAFIAGVIGSITAIWKVYQIYAKSRQKREEERLRVIINESLKPVQEELATVKNELHTVRSELEDNNIQTARLDLNTAIEHTPHEHEAILKLAEHYFLDLGGDAWMSGKFRKWAKEENVDISYIVEKVPHLKG